MLLFSSRGALDFPVPTRPVHRAVKLNQFPARIRHSQARHFATNCRPGTSIHPQTLLTDRCEVHFTALARVYVTFPFYHIFCTSEGLPPQKHRGPRLPRQLCAVSVPKVGRDCRFPAIPRGLGAGEGTRTRVFGHSEWSRCRRRDETVGFQRFREVSVPKKGRDCWFRGIREVSVPEVGRDCWFRGLPSGLGAEGGTRLLVSGESVWSRCRRWDETIGFRGFRVVSVPEVGRDCWFRGLPSGLGAGGGTRLPVSGNSARSRCRRWDETAGFRGFRVVSVSEVGRDRGFSVIPSGLGAEGGTRPRGFRGFRVVSVPEEGRDCRFPGISCGLGAGGGTRLLVSGDSRWSRCHRRDETAGFRRIRVVSVLKVGRGLRFSGIPRGLGAGRGTRLPVSGESAWSRCRKRDETAGFQRFRVVSVPEEGGNVDKNGW